MVHCVFEKHRPRGVQEDNNHHFPVSRTFFDKPRGSALDFFRTNHKTHHVRQSCPTFTSTFTPQTSTPVDFARSVAFSVVVSSGSRWPVRWFPCTSPHATGRSRPRPVARSGDNRRYHRVRRRVIPSGRGCKPFHCSLLEWLFPFYQMADFSNGWNIDFCLNSRLERGNIRD